MLNSFAQIAVVYLAVSHGFQIQPKVLNGAVSNPADYPYFVWISGEIWCCGSLISDSWVLTAGHCIENSSPFNVSIGMRPDGSHDMTVLVDIQHQHVFSKEYERDYYDIGLIELPTRIPFGQHIQPAKLPQSCVDMPEMETTKAIGAGRLNRFDTAFGVMREASLNIAPCNATGQLSVFKITDPQALICAFPVTFGANPYLGDSGGPFIRQEDGVQFGVIQLGLYNGHIRPLFVFTKISYFFDWISAKTGINLPSCEAQAPTTR